MSDLKELANMELIILGCYETAYILEHECRHWYPYYIWIEIYTTVSDSIFVENRRLQIHREAKVILCPWKVNKT